MKRTFRQELQEDLSRELSRLTVWLVSGLLLALVFFAFSMQTYQLNRETDRVVKTFNQVDRQSWRLMDDLNQKIVPQYLEGRRAERELFSRLYEELSRQYQRGELVLTDVKGERRWTSNTRWAETVLPASYLKAVVQNCGNKRVTKVTRLGKDRPSLVLVAPVYSKHQILGYSLLFLNGNDFHVRRPTEVSQFVIADRLRL